jgi:uncharacterized protein YeaO (DUF488 family)
MKRETLPLDGWLKEVAPSDALRRWFRHDPKKWGEFQRRYVTELNGKPEAWQLLLEATRQGTVTLLYSARDPDHNSAVALKSYLEAILQKKEEFHH